MSMQIGLQLLYSNCTYTAISAVRHDTMALTPGGQGSPSFCIDPASSGKASLGALSDEDLIGCQIGLQACYRVPTPSKLCQEDLL